MLALNDIELQQTRFYQEIANEERQEGKQEGEVRLLKRHLSKRFGRLPINVINQLEKAETEQLELWAEELLYAKTIANLFQ